MTNRQTITLFLPLLLVGHTARSALAVMEPVWHGAIKPGQVIFWNNYPYEVDEYVQITVVGEGTTDLQLRVLGEDKRVIAADEDPGDICRVLFRLQRAERIRVELTNAGKRKSHCYLITRNVSAGRRRGSPVKLPHHIDESRTLNSTYSWFLQYKAGETVVVNAISEGAPLALELLDIRLQRIAVHQRAYRFPAVAFKADKDGVCIIKLTNAGRKTTKYRLIARTTVKS